MKLYTFFWEQAYGGGVMLIASPTKKAAIALAKTKSSDWSYDSETPNLAYTGDKTEPTVVLSQVYQE